MCILLRIVNSNGGDESKQTEEESEHSPSSGVSVLITGDDARENGKCHRLNEEDADNHGEWKLLFSIRASPRLSVAVDYERRRKVSILISERSQTPARTPVFRR